jgi:DNA-binding MarR family transcriptional regulator
MSSSNQKRKRQRRDQRAKHPTPMREGVNDRRIVGLLYDYRVLSQQQIEQLMGLARSTVQRLLKRLYDHGYLEREFPPVSHIGSSPTLYVLDKKGLDLLRRMGFEDVPDVPSKGLSGTFLEHTMAINIFRIAITQACLAQGWEIAGWLTENELKADYDRVRVAGKKRSVALVPDGYFTVRVPGKGLTHFFLELDRGTMTVARFREKIKAYVVYYKSGGYAKRYGAQGFRVLTVVDGIGVGRVDSLVEGSGEVRGIGRRFWFGHLENMRPERVLDDEVWQIAGANGKVPLFGE